MKEIKVRTKAVTEYVDLTSRLKGLIEGEGVDKGIIQLFVPHTTAAITVNEGADPSVLEDLDTSLEELVPRQGSYRHLEGNAAAHIRSVLVGPSLQVIVEGGRLRLGRWQSIFFCEFDGPRQRRVWYSILTG